MIVAQCNSCKRETQIGKARRGTAPAAWLTVDIGDQLTIHLCHECSMKPMAFGDGALTITLAANRSLQTVDFA